MLKTTVYDMTGKAVGEAELSDAVFGVEPNKSAMHMLVRSHMANMRQGTQSALTRAEVSGGGAKPYRQKGTGRARQGSTRAPQWRHGGIVFAPKPRDYSFAVNKKLRKVAIRSALSSKVLENKLILVDDIKFDTPKTRAFAAFLAAVKAEKALVVTAAPDKNTALAGRNLLGVKTEMANLINTYDILKYDAFILDKASLAVIEEVFA